jgi:predicted aspartyl protease
MITGTVNAHHEIVVPLAVGRVPGQTQQIDFVLDTGFDGSLTLPPALVARLSLPWHSRGRATLANGQIEQFDVYLAVMNWDGALRPVLVQEVSATPLLGMAPLLGHDLSVRVAVGGAVEINSIP